MSEALVFPDGRFVLNGQTMPIALGRAGVRALKEEGDGATPAGLLPLRRVFYRADRVGIPRTSLPREPIARADGWCDDPSHQDYNQMVGLPHPGRHEALWREDNLYDVIAVLGWNDSPIVRRRGSAIFLHVAAADLAPTDGCLALSIGDLLKVLSSGLTEVRILEG